MTPYDEAFSFIERNSGTGGARGLSKLILSLWNDNCCFSLRECIDSLDGKNTDIAVRMVAHFAVHGEDSQLVEIGHKVCELYPRLWDISKVAVQAKAKKRREWEEEDRRAEAEDE